MSDNHSEVEMISVPRALLEIAVNPNLQDKERFNALAKLRVVLDNTPSRAQIEEDNRFLQMRDDAERSQVFFGDDE